MKLTSKLSLGLLATLVMSAAMATPKVKTAMEMPAEIRGIYSDKKSDCAAYVQNYKKHKEASYPLIEKQGVFWGNIVSCQPKKVSGGNGVYKVEESCDEAGEPTFKISTTYTLKDDVLTHSNKNGSTPYHKCEAL